MKPHKKLDTSANFLIVDSKCSDTLELRHELKAFLESMGFADIEKVSATNPLNTIIHLLAEARHDNKKYFAIVARNLHYPRVWAKHWVDSRVLSFCDCYIFSGNIKMAEKKEG
jgi:3-keto-L-gulonate-6-phosphate decarboxylase